ncbi:hypothetical protein GC197_17135 [bacterium]|nr:hypothetical protein [bacterium]
MNDDEAVDAQLRLLTDLADRLDETETHRELINALGHSVNLVVERAADMVAPTGNQAFIPPLTKAYWRLKRNPLKRDAGCLGKTAIVKALVHLEHDDLEIFRDAIEYTQVEPRYPHPVDTAAELRGICAIGLIHFAPPLEVLNRCAVLLADPWPNARLGAVRAIGALASAEGAPLLKLKLLLGDDEAEVHGECCSALLKIEKEEALSFVQPFLETGDSDMCVQTALAIGESQFDGAFEILRTAWGRRAELAVRESLLLCVGLIRSTASQDFLLSLITSHDVRTASDAIKALQLSASLGDIRQRTEAAVEATGNEQLARFFASEWRDAR